jgi:hypothetical protein
LGVAPHLSARLACAEEPAATQPEEHQPSEATPDAPWEVGKWYKLFDGKTLEGWKSTQFGGEGEVRVEKDQQELVIEMGSSMTGITYTGKRPLPEDNYEIRLEAKRVKGSDFFCALTAPYKKSHFSLVVGGWGGGVVGISSIDGYDASENSTTSYMPFKNDEWHKIRLKVHGGKIEAQIDDKTVVDFEIGEHELSTRVEVDLSKPLGISTWESSSVIRNLELRRLPEVAENP